MRTLLERLEKKPKIAYTLAKEGDRVVRVIRNFRVDPTGMLIGERGKVEGTVQRVIPVERRGTASGVPLAWVRVIWDNFPNEEMRVPIQQLEVVGRAT